MKKRKVAIWALFVCSLWFGFESAGGFASPALAADYPARPIRIIVGFAPGGSVDSSARLVAAKLGEVLKQAVIVENRTGAGSTIAAGLVAKEKPDGYTLLMASAALSPAPALYKLTYDMNKDLAPIIQVGDTANVLIAHPSVPANTVKELIALAKAQPGKLAYGSSGLGTTPHLAGELFCNMAGVKMLHVPYKGGSQSTIDLLAGQIQLIFATATAAIPHMESGKVKGIAVLGKKRTPLLPNMPTVAEGGLPGYDVPNWNGLLAPAKTPRPIINRLNAEVAKVLAMPDIKEAFFKMGQTPEPCTPEEFGAYLESQTRVWAKLIKDAGIQIN